MKICSSCRKNLPLEDFHLTRTKKTEFAYSCKICHAAYMWQKQEKKRKIAWNYLLTHPCVDCGESDPTVLEFDHIRGEKVSAVCDMVKKGCRDSEIISEMGKCDIRCANCHRRITASRSNNFKHRMSQPT